MSLVGPSHAGEQAGNTTGFMQEVRGGAESLGRRMKTLKSLQENWFLNGIV